MGGLSQKQKDQFTKVNQYSSNRENCQKSPHVRICENQKKNDECLLFLSTIRCGGGHQFPYIWHFHVLLIDFLDGSWI